MKNKDHIQQQERDRERERETCVLIYSFGNWTW